MTDRLRGVLAEIAETAPVVHVPDDTFRRARRERRRSQAYAALAAVVVLLAGAGIVQVHRSSTPVASTRSVALPDHIYAVPERLLGQREDGSWSGPVESDLAIGRGVVAYRPETGPAVVVTATDDRYHLLDLPGFLGNALFTSGAGAGLALSPDGRSLAYAYGDGPTADGSPSSSGVRVADLVTGHVRTVEIPTDAQGTLVRQIVWSPDSQWLAWYGQTATSWTRSSTTYHGEVRGVIAPGAATSAVVEGMRTSSVAMAVDDGGYVHLLSTRRLVRVHQDVDGSGGRTSVGLVGSVEVDGPSTMAASPRGDVLVVPRATPTHRAAILGGFTDHAATFPIRATGNKELSTGADGATLAPLGFLGPTNDPIVVPNDAKLPLQPPTKALVVVTPQQDGRTSTRQLAVLDTVHRLFRAVTDVDAGVPPDLTVATSLVGADPRTAHVPPPEWPWSAGHKLAVVGGSVAGVLALVWLALVVVRRRRRA